MRTIGIYMTTSHLPKVSPVPAVIVILLLLLLLLACVCVVCNVY